MILTGLTLSFHQQEVISNLSQKVKEAFFIMDMDIFLEQREATFNLLNSQHESYSSETEFCIVSVVIADLQVSIQ